MPDVPATRLQPFHQATTSTARLESLHLFVEQRSMTISELKHQLGCVQKAAKQHVDGLVAGGLVDASAKPRYTVTDAGIEIYALVAGAEPVSAVALRGRRLLALQFADSDPTVVGRAIAAFSAEVYAADGDLDLVAVLPDDPKLAKDLRHQLRGLGATRVLQARVWFAASDENTAS